MELSSRTRRILSTVLALVLAVESVSAVAAAAVAGPAGNPLPADVPAAVVPAAEADVAPVAARAVDVSTAPAGAPRVVEPAPRPTSSPAVAAATATQTRTDHAAAATTRGQLTAKAASKAASKATPAPAAKSARAPSTGSASKARSFSGTNHVWIPELGISRSVRSFACSRTRPPDNYMYRWGCAGSNNVYLLGHAYGVMRGLHDAYVRGRLHAGMRAWYADGRGRVHSYAVRWWKVTRPTTAASWAWAALSRPSMTLQTCVGSHSQYRLMVRLVEVGG